MIDFSLVQEVQTSPFLGVEAIELPVEDYKLSNSRPQSSL